MKKVNYELALVLHPELNSEDRDKQIGLVEKIITQLGGEVTKREEGGKKILAYPIYKQSQAWYYFLQLNLPPEAITQLETKLKMEEKVLRYLVLKK